MFINNLMQEYKDSYTYLFADKKFIQKLWLLPVVMIFLPPLGVVLLKGWQVQMVQDIAHEKPLQAIDFKQTFIKGVQIFLATMAYYLFVPEILCQILGFKGIIASIFYLLRDSSQSAWVYLIQNRVAVLVIYTIWGLISNPILQSGIVRHALTSDWKTFFNVPANFLFMMRHAHYFIKFYVFYLITLLFLMLLEFLLAPMWVLIVTFIFSLCLPILYYGAVSHELGHLAHKIHHQKNKSEIENIENKE